MKPKGSVKHHQTLSSHRWDLGMRPEVRAEQLEQSLFDVMSIKVVREGPDNDEENDIWTSVKVMYCVHLNYISIHWKRANFQLL